MERIPEKVDSKFRYVLLAATRCEQIMQGAPLRMEHPPQNRKLTRMAMEEIIADAVVWDYGPEPEPVADESAAAPPEEAPGTVEE